MIDFRPARPTRSRRSAPLSGPRPSVSSGLMDALAADEPSPAAVLAARIYDGGLVVAVEAERSWGS
jgi:hypothetical protein